MKSNTLTSRLLIKALALTLSGWIGMSSVNAAPMQLALGGGQGQSNNSAQEPQISQRRALELVRERFPGTVVSINQVQQGGTLQYRVRMDNEGNIFTVYVNATNGAITREQ